MAHAINGEAFLQWTGLQDKMPDGMAQHIRCIDVARALCELTMNANRGIVRKCAYIARCATVRLSGTTSERTSFRVGEYSNRHALAGTSTHCYS